jgi:hypothetical protein
LGGRGSGGGNWVPDSIKAARGTWRPDRARGKPELASYYVQGVPRRPRGLTEAERKVWRELTEQLSARGILCRLDRDALCVLTCLTVRVANGRATRREISEWMRWRAEFGMTRNTWGKVPVLPEPDEEDE